MTILDKIAERTKERISEKKSKNPKSALLKIAEERAKERKPNCFEEALRREGVSFICEVKKASPSKGIIDKEFNYLEIASSYEKIKADAISCLTEPFFFEGSDRYLEEIAQKVSTPILRKDFTVDEYMVYEASALSASAILLIAAILDEYQLRDYYDIALSLNLSSLFEVHNEKELEKVMKASPRIVGINNRDLHTFEVSLDTTVKLRRYIPSEVVAVSESGISKREDIILLENNNVDACLLGEFLMREKDKEQALNYLRGK